MLIYTQTLDILQQIYDTRKKTFVELPKETLVYLPIQINRDRL